MLSDLQAIESVLSRAAAPEDIFGKLDGKDAASRTHALNHVYRKLVVTVHPDHYSHDDDKAAFARATTLFKDLTDWKTKAEEKINSGTYGDGKPHVAAPPPPAPSAPQVIQTPKRKYIVQEMIAQGDLADLYRCTYVESGKDIDAVFKVVQSAGDNDLAENESKVLRAIYPDKQPEEKFYRYLPKLLDTFILRQSGSANRRVNVLQKAEGYVTLAEVIQAYPKGLDFRDVVWMLKRCLAGIGFVHTQKKVVHGAMIPTHILIHPTGHGAKIVDWSYAVSDYPSGSGRVKAISKAYKIFYPKEILEKKAVTPQTDIFMLGKSIVALLGGDLTTNQLPDSVPKQFRAFVSAMVLPAQKVRPDNAWELHEELDQLLEKIVGKATYRPLAMPVK